MIKSRLWAECRRRYGYGEVSWPNYTYSTLDTLCPYIANCHLWAGVLTPTWIGNPLQGVRASPRSPNECYRGAEGACVYRTAVDALLIGESAR